MHDQLPVWAQWLQLGATIFVALIATRIAYGQWRTAHQKVLLDLFERRMAVYEAMREPIAEIVREGRASDATYFAYTRATDRLPLLFGNEIVNYSLMLRENINQLALHTTMIRAKHNGEPVPDFAEHVNKKGENLKQIVKFYEEFPTLLAPYIRMTQRETSLWKSLKPF